MFPAAPLVCCSRKLHDCFPLLSFTRSILPLSPIHKVNESRDTIRAHGSFGRNLPSNFLLSSTRHRDDQRRNEIFLSPRFVVNFRLASTFERLVDLPNLDELFAPTPLAIAKVITFSDVRWRTISYRRGVAAYRTLSLARSSRILFLGCGFARCTLLGNWTWSRHAGSPLAAHLLPLLYLWVAKFTKRCGPTSECLPYNAAG